MENIEIIEIFSLKIISLEKGHFFDKNKIVPPVSRCKSQYSKHLYFLRSDM